MVVEKKNAPTATQNVREENMSNKSISVKFWKIGAKYLCGLQPHEAPTPMNSGVLFYDCSRKHW